MQFSSLSGASVFLLGAGVTGPDTAMLLTLAGARVHVVDDNEQAATALSETVTGIESVMSTEQARNAMGTDRSPQLLVTSPGWRPDWPIFADAASHNIPVWGDLDVAYQADRAEFFGPKKTWIAITGTNGKTTTTSMVEAIMVAAGKSALACGNIGLPLARAVMDKDSDVLVCELSSFQLHWSTDIRFDTGALINIAEDHLDWHGSMENYVADKALVFHAECAVANREDSHVLTATESSQHRTLRTCGMSTSECSPGDVGVQDNQIVVMDSSGAPQRVMSTADVNPSSPAGVWDAMVAIAIACQHNIAVDIIASALASFHPGQHRQVDVGRSVEGITFINDSKATNPHAALAALQGRDCVVWLAGGVTKGADVSSLVQQIVPALRAAVVFGEDASAFAAALTTYAPSVPLTVLQWPQDRPSAEQMMDDIVSAAIEHAEPGDTVLLSPAAASMDMFDNYSHRGEAFTTAVENFVHQEQQ